MKAPRDYRDYLLDIFQYAEKGERIVKGLDFEDFQGNEEKILASIRIIEVIGEATKYLPDTFREQYPDVPWRGMARMRDKLIHAYFGVDVEVVWRTMNEDLPPLRNLIGKILDDLEEMDR